MAWVFLLLILQLIWAVLAIGTVYFTVKWAFGHSGKLGDIAYILMLSWFLVLAAAFIPSPDSPLLEAFVLFVTSGAFGAIALLGRWASSALEVGLSALAIGFVVGGIALAQSYRILQLNRKSRALLTLLIFGMVTWVCSEVLLSIQMGNKAHMISSNTPYCLSRSIVPKMIWKFESKLHRFSDYGTLTTQDKVYTWVFRTKSWDAYAVQENMDSDYLMSMQSRLVYECRAKVESHGNRTIQSLE